jgi:hydrogenase nickel incorporation protein HypA/HybF
MHEYSIVQALMDLAQDEAQKAGAEQIESITVKVGRLSGVESDLLRDAYEVFSEDHFCKGAKLVLLDQKVVLFCESCQKESTLDKLTLACPACGSDGVRVIDGEELILMRLEMH